MRPFVVLAVNVAIGSVGLWVGGFAGGCILAALGVADCMAVIAEGRAWKREDAADARLEAAKIATDPDPGLDWNLLTQLGEDDWEPRPGVFDWQREKAL